MNRCATTLVDFRGFGPQGWRLALAFFLCLVLTPLAGCAFKANVLALFNEEKPAAIPASAGAAEIIHHLNTNIAHVSGWRSSRARLTAHGSGAIPMPLVARIDVQEPRNFRVRVSVMGSPQADLGSNAERFWFWMREGQPKCVLTARHEEMAEVKKLPFEPRWVMQALGVVRMNEGEYELERPGQQSSLVELVAKRAAPDGRPTRHVVRVDTQAGHIIAHELYDASNRVIARAELSDYRVESGQGVVLPHEIRLDWPQFDFGLTMTIREIEVNPNVPAMTWTMPAPNNYPVLDLAHLPPSMQQMIAGPRPNGVPLAEVPGGGKRWDGLGSRGPTARPLAHMPEEEWVPDTVRYAGHNVPQPADTPPRRNWLQKFFGF